MNKEIMKAAGFTEEVKQVELGNCPICGDTINPNAFRD